MIVIVASRYDILARRLVERWAGNGGCLLTPADLSVEGWRYCPDNPLDSTAIFGGREARQSEVHGVFTRLQWVWEDELVDIVSGDRAYVAAEMSAFLLCWLAGLSCPVLNRPTPGCLTGPGWGREQWLFAASKAGMRVQPVKRQASFASSSPSIDETPKPALTAVTVAGDRCLGNADEALLTQARRLAEIAGVDLLGVQFTGVEADACFAGATCCPDVDSDCVADAALSYLLRV
jgi:hypothetical protein